MVAPPAPAALNDWQDVESGRLERDDGIATNAWVRVGDDLILAEQGTGTGGGTRLHDVSLYDRSGGRLVAVVTAERGRPAQGGWLLEEVERFDVGATRAVRAPSTLIARGIEPDQFTLADVRADEQDFAALRESIGDLESAGFPPDALRAGDRKSTRLNSRP